MTKEDLLSGFLYLVMAGVIILVGFLAIRPAFSNELNFLKDGMTILFLVVALIIGVVLNVILFALGHALGAKLGGYTILLNNLLGFCFYKYKKEDGKISTKFGFKSFNGLTGDMIIAPKKENSNPMFYVFMPLIFILLEIAAYIAVASMLTSKSGNALFLIKYGLMVVATVGGCMGIYNYFPAKLDSVNDGYRLVLLRKKVNIEAYNVRLGIEAREYFNEAYEEPKVFEEITDFTAQVNNETAMYKFSNGETESALEILDKLFADEKKISKNTLRDIKINKAFIYFLTKDLESAKELINSFDEETNTYITNCKSLGAIRTYILYIGLIEKSKSEIEFALGRIKKFKEKVSSGTYIKEKEFIKRATDYVNENSELLKEFDYEIYFK